MNGPMNGQMDQMDVPARLKRKTASCASISSPHFLVNRLPPLPTTAQLPWRAPANAQGLPPIGPLVHSLVRSFGPFIWSIHLVHSFGPFIGCIHWCIHWSIGPFIGPFIWSTRHSTCNAPPPSLDAVSSWYRSLSQPTSKPCMNHI